MAGRTSLSLTEERERRLERLRKDTGEKTNAKAIDQAARHHRLSKLDVEALADDLEDEYQEDADQRALGSFRLEVSVDIVD